MTEEVEEQLPVVEVGPETTRDGKFPDEHDGQAELPRYNLRPRRTEKAKFTHAPRSFSGRKELKRVLCRKRQWKITSMR